ncbi:putative LRR receptor-like serine/threonine-protein kinase [Prunus yedoensis var. nudiflora]|uniref:Putative LRR receptor-like serine/threonine-protein kinase n=1 Tax=Prunus yedoensis var. nudiflora TaxID=2094558 RepID=A0A314XIZ4_PRUYE|nr:putative LRR receptor-like serine/threonine-protein kinase [Prunus yedoensis var. nudiflora]
MRGKIPEDIGNLSSLIVLVLGNNQLTGSIPTSVGRLRNLQGLYLDGNKLHGDIPHQLCQLARLAEFRLDRIISAILLVASLSLLMQRRKSKVKVATETALLPQLLWRRVSHLELLRATNGFHESKLLGTEGFGSVYRGTISDGIDVAVKVFNLQIEGAFKSFDSECDVLSNIRH